MFSLIVFLFLENSKKYAEYLLLTHFEELFAQAHICIAPIINTLIDIWMKLKGHMQKQTFPNKIAIVFLVGSCKPCIHSHPSTPSQKRSHSHSLTLTHTNPHSAKKSHAHPHPPTPSKKKVKLIHIHPHPAKRRSYLPTYNWNKECHVSSTYVQIFPFHNISRCLHFWKRLTSSSFSIEYFWNGIWIYCLFVCFQQLANDM